MVLFTSILIRDKYELIKASEILEKIGIKVFSDEKVKSDVLKWDDIKDNYLMKDEDGWRIQSHLLKEKYNIELLEKIVDCLIVKYPNITKDIEKIYEMEKTKKELTEQIEEVKNEITKQIEESKKELIQNK